MKYFIFQIIIVPGGPSKLFKIPHQPDEGFTDRDYAENFLKSLIRKAGSFPFNVPNNNFIIYKVYQTENVLEEKVIN